MMVRQGWVTQVQIRTPLGYGVFVHSVRPPWPTLGLNLVAREESGIIQRGSAAWGVPGHGPRADGRFMDREAPHRHVDLRGGLTWAGFAAPA